MTRAILFPYEKMNHCAEVTRRQLGLLAEFPNTQLSHATAGNSHPVSLLTLRSEQKILRRPEAFQSHPRDFISAASPGSGQGLSMFNVSKTLP